MIFVDRTASREIQFHQQIERCYDDFCFYNRFDFEKRESFVKRKMDTIEEDELVIPYLPLYLTTACSLNCEKCNNLMPMFHGKAYDFSWAKTNVALDIVLREVKELIFCELVGGESFLNKDFAEILDYVGNNKKILQIVVITNATVIPKADILERLKKYNVLVRVSDYGLFDRMSEFIAELDKYGINVRIQQDMKWNDPGDVQARGRSVEELKKQYNACEFSLKCKYLCEDKLFSCARAASMYHLGLFDSEKDILCIDNNTTKEEIRAFYLHENGDICDYCDLWTAECKLIPAAKQVGDNKFRHSDYTVISNYELNHYKKITREYEMFLTKSRETNQ